MNVLKTLIALFHLRAKTVLKYAVVTTVCFKIFKT